MESLVFCGGSDFFPQRVPTAHAESQAGKAALRGMMVLPEPHHQVARSSHFGVTIRHIPKESVLALFVFCF